MFNTRYGTTQVIAQAALNTGRTMDEVEEDLVRHDIRKAIAAIDHLNNAGGYILDPEEVRAIERLNAWCYEVAS